MHELNCFFNHELHNKILMLTKAVKSMVTHLLSMTWTPIGHLSLDEEFEHTKDEHFMGSITWNQFLGILWLILKFFLYKPLSSWPDFPSPKTIKSITSLQYEDFTLWIKLANKDVKTVNSAWLCGLWGLPMGVSNVEFSQKILNGINPACDYQDSYVILGTFAYFFAKNDYVVYYMIV